ncbi:hypothetical protein C7212DRAFT_341101 [Tuber magnatum]|uniref:F-box domain-containing protein n=1 Tax=Tuber magnatum TaxID=42249 RepID=A0A317SZU8_9PEZI|nr:hypothetical protein C7212DRAFT_341101 [Tuber magnatum]
MSNPTVPIPPPVEPKPAVIKIGNGHSILQLPTELIIQILGYISFNDRPNLRLVSKRFARVSERFIFRSIRLYLPRGADIPTLEQSIYFSTRIFSSGANEVRIYGDAGETLGWAGVSPDACPSHKSDKRINAVDTGLLRNTTSVFTSLSKISLDFGKNVLPHQHGHGALALKFLEALHADTRKSQITSIGLHNLPLWILQKLSAERPKVLNGSLRHVKKLSLGITPHLQINVNDKLNIYHNYQSFDTTARRQLSTAYTAFREFLASAPDVEDFSLDWFSTKETVASWKALSPIGDTNSLCKPAAGADTARIMLIGEEPERFIWVNTKGGYTTMWQSLRKLKLANLIMCPYQLTQTVLGAKTTLVELELDRVYLNMSCQYVDWGRGVLTSWRSAYRTERVPFRLSSFTARNLGYTSYWDDFPQNTFESYAALMRG